MALSVPTGSESVVVTAVSYPERSLVFIQNDQPMPDVPFSQDEWLKDTALALRAVS